MGYGVRIKDESGEVALMLEFPHHTVTKSFSFRDKKNHSTLQRICENYFKLQRKFKLFVGKVHGHLSVGLEKSLFRLEVSNTYPCFTKLVTKLIIRSFVLIPVAVGSLKGSFMTRGLKI